MASKISLSNYKFSPEKIKLDALKIYTDEAFHAYSKRIEQQLKEYYSIDTDFDKYVSPFFEKVDSFLDLANQKNENDLIELALIIIAENTILFDLSESMRGLVYEPIINMFKDHINDEAFHASFHTSFYNNMGSTK